jgi:hypothetical protein
MNNLSPYISLESGVKVFFHRNQWPRRRWYLRPSAFICGLYLRYNEAAYFLLAEQLKIFKSEFVFPAYITTLLCALCML